MSAVPQQTKFIVVFSADNAVTMKRKPVRTSALMESVLPEFIFSNLTLALNI
jgi:hypothetical protein